MKRYHQRIGESLPWRQTWLVMFFLLSLLPAVAQNTATIGSGTSTTTSTGSDPIDGYFASFRYQTVYTAAELSGAGMVSGATITAMGFSIAGDYGGGDLNGYTIGLLFSTLLC